MRRRSFLLLPLAARLSARTAEVPVPRKCGPAPRSSFPATTALIRTFAPSGGTSPAGSATRPGATSASRSRSSAIGPACRRPMRAGSRRRNCCSRTRHWRIPTHGRLRHDQRAARAGFGLAEASLRDDRRAHRRLVAGARRRPLSRPHRRERLRVRSHVLGHATDAAAGRSRCQPQRARVRCRRASTTAARTWPSKATITVAGKREAVRGTAWLDHEWSSEYLAPEAAGWDWVGLHFDDGAALMAFRIRHRDGGVLWAGGSLRDARGIRRVFSPGEVTFEPVRVWRSPRTGTRLARGDATARGRSRTRRSIP